MACGVPQLLPDWVPNFIKKQKHAQFYKTLDPKFFFPICVFTDIMKGLYYLPKFAGGQEGEGDFKEFRRETRKKFKEMKMSEK